MPYSETPSAYVPPLMSATKFHTHTKQQAKTIILYILIFKFWIANWKTKDPLLYRTENLNPRDVWGELNL